MKKERKIITSFCFLSLLIALAVFCGSAGAEVRKAAGHAIFVHDAVWRSAPEKAREPLNKGDKVFETDTIITGKKGSAQLVMADGAFIAVRPNTSIRLDKYRYEQEKDEWVGESVITLLKGCFRSITGLIGKKNKENYRVKTAIANIGIRGTDHEPLYIPEPLEGEVPIGEPGLYDKVNSGETYIETEAGVVSIYPNQVGYVSDQMSVAVVEDTIPDVYEQYSATLSTGAAGSNDDDSEASAQQSTFISEFSGPIDDPAKDELITTDMPVVEGDPVRRGVGTVTWSDTIDNKGILGFNTDEKNIIADEDGRFTGYQLPSANMPNPSETQTVSIVNPTTGTRQLAAHFSETGIHFGTWAADAINRISFDGSDENSPAGNGLVHWITGTSSDPDYLSQIISGTQVYTFDGGTSPTNQDGIAGTLDSATLSVDFSRQAVDTSLQMTVNSYIWTASATDIPMVSGTFSESSPSLTILRDGAFSPNAWGHLSGSLAGDGLNGAVIGYTLGDTSISETINGTASFYGAEQDTDTTYREIGIAGTDYRAPESPVLAQHSVSSAANISTDGAGRINGFNALLPNYAASPSGDIQSAIELDIGSATLTDAGTDTESGISWGRWSGSVSATDRLTGVSVAPAFTPDNLHFIAGPEMSSQVVLPITGTRTYQFAGGTNPTDNMGNVGTLNSATLTADFSNMTVATGINATVNANTFDASSSATPIENGRYFTATHNDSLTVSSNISGDGITHSGVISGSFYGNSGESAGVAYSFNATDGSTIDTTISGVAGFKQ